MPGRPRGRAKKIANLHDMACSLSAALAAECPPDAIGNVKDPRVSGWACAIDLSIALVEIVEGLANDAASRAKLPPVESFFPPIMDDDDDVFEVFEGTDQSDCDDDADQVDDDTVVSDDEVDPQPDDDGVTVAVPDDDNEDDMPTPKLD